MPEIEVKEHPSYVLTDRLHAAFEAIGVPLNYKNHQVGKLEELHGALNDAQKLALEPIEPEGDLLNVDLSKVEQAALARAGQLLEDAEKLPLAQRQARIMEAATLLGIPLAQMTDLMPKNMAAAPLKPGEAEERAKRRKPFKHHRRG